MNPHFPASANESPLDLSRWRRLPVALMAGGGVLSLVGAVVSPLQFSYSYLTAFMFFLSLGLGALFLVIMHHLFDSQWMVPLRRVWEQMACLFPVLALLFVPILLNVLLAGPDTILYRWMAIDPHHDHSLHVKQVLFNKPVFILASALLFGIWSGLALLLRKFSIEQDRTGAAACTFKMRRLSAGGILVFAITLTLGAIFWMKSLEHQWFSTMYGVYYFAGSVWVTLATTYVLAVVLRRAGPLRAVIQEKTMHDTGVLFFAFTVFYAYIHFSQYFLIWNAAIPEETFWYIKRENGNWSWVGILLIVGHFFVPFLAMLRIDAKKYLPLMLPLCGWAWFMHYLDMSFNIKPVFDPQGQHIISWLDIGTFAFFAGVLAAAWLKLYSKHPAFPQRDPRLAEAMGVYVAPAATAHSQSGPA
jgi:hypothetical protein